MSLPPSKHNNFDDLDLFAEQSKDSSFSHLPQRLNLFAVSSSVNNLIQNLNGPGSIPSSTKALIELT